MKKNPAITALICGSMLISKIFHVKTWDFFPYQRMTYFILTKLQAALPQKYQTDHQFLTVYNGRGSYVLLIKVNIKWA